MQLFLSAYHITALFHQMCCCVRRPQGQFIYVKYAFEELEAGPPVYTQQAASGEAQPQLWSLTALDACMPSGLSGMFTYVLRTLKVRH